MRTNAGLWWLLAAFFFLVFVLYTGWNLISHWDTNATGGQAYWETVTLSIEWVGSVALLFTAFMGALNATFPDVGGDCLDAAEARVMLAPAVRELCRGLTAHAVARGAFGTAPDELHAVDRLHELRARTLVVVGDLDSSDIHAVADRLCESVPGAGC